MKHLAVLAALVAACPAHALEQDRPHKHKSFAGVVCTNARAAKAFTLLLRAEGDVGKAFAASDKGTFASCDAGRIAGRQVGASPIEMVPIKGVMHRIQVTSVATGRKAAFVIRCDRLKGLIEI